MLIGGPGADELDGGAGMDTAHYDASRGGVEVYLDGVDDSGRELERHAFGGDADGDRLVNVENVTGSPFSDVLGGDVGPNCCGAAATTRSAAGAAPTRCTAAAATTR